MKKIISSALVIICIGMLLPQQLHMPVEGATASSYNPESFWYYPWGTSGTHKGVDIFARKGTELKASTNGIVLFTGSLGKGGNVILLLGPKWRLHYYAHLESIHTKSGAVVRRDRFIGTVGDSGNAKGKAPHLHYSIKTLLPYPWRIDDSPQGWRKMFFLNPIDYLS